MGVNVRFDVDRLKGLSRCKAGGGAAAAGAAAWRKTRGPGPRPGAGRSTQDDVFCGANFIIGVLRHASDYCFPPAPTLPSAPPFWRILTPPPNRQTARRHVARKNNL